MNKWIENPTFLNDLSQNEKTIAKEDINLFTCKYPIQLNKIKECVRWAIDMFIENYNNSINQLLNTFSPTHEITPGILFWSGGKRCPKPILFDISNSLHIDYIEATTHILARCSGLIDDFTRDELYEMISDYTLKEIIPTDKQITSSEGIIAKFNPQEFEKDDDTNWHINWITASSNLRAYNYNIPNATKQQTKGIAGRIIPAIATTTAAVSGLILLEMLKYLNGFKQVNLYRSTFINLAEPMLVYSDPIEASMINIAGNKINSWTKFEYIHNSTLCEFKKYYEELFKINISMIVVGNSMIYADFLDDESLNKSLNDIIISLEINIKSMVVFNIMTDIENIEIPAITVNLKNNLFN
jgi:ubiquitin-activating enzyme E1